MKGTCVIRSQLPRRRAWAAALLLLVPFAVIPSPATAVDRSLTIAAASDPQLTQIMAFRAGNAPWSNSVFETLVTLDPKNRQPKPLLATSWTISKDKMAIVLKLRSGVTYHSGRTFTADDAKYSLEQAALPTSGSQLGFIARSFKGMTVVSPTQLRIDFTAPTSNIFDLLALIPMVDSTTFATIKAGKDVVGTGPFTWVSWTPGASVQLTKYPAYRDAAKISLDSITVRIINNASAQLNALRSGAVDVAMGLSVTDALTMDIMPGFSVIRAGGTIYPFGMNTSIAPFNDVRVRQAVAFAIDRKRLNEQVFGYTGTPTNLFWNKTEPGWNAKQASYYKYDPTKGKALVDAAGAQGAAVSVIVPNIPIMKQIYEVVANNLTAIGLKPTANILDVTVYDAKQVAGDLGQAWLPLHGQVGLGAGTLISSLPTLREGNGAKYWTPEYQAARAALLKADTVAQKSKALQALSDRLLKDVPATVMVQAPGLFAYSDRAKGITFTGLGYPNYSKVKLA